MITPKLSFVAGMLAVGGVVWSGAAQKGAGAISSVLGEDLERDDNKLDLAIAQFYAWGSDLDSVKVDSSSLSRNNKVLQR